MSSRTDTSLFSRLLGLFITGFLLILPAMIIGWARPTKAGDFHQYVTKDGVLSFTDRGFDKGIPEAYRVGAQERSWAEVRSAVEGQFTKSQPTVAPAVDPTFLADRHQQLPETQAPFEPYSQHQPNCDGVVATKERIQEGEHNRSYWFVYNSCGRLISRTPFAPEVLLPR